MLNDLQYSEIMSFLLGNKLWRYVWPDSHD